MAKMTEEQLRKMKEGKERWELERRKPGYVQPERRKTPMRAIREKCLDCCCGSAYEVKMCEVKDCALFTFRLGRKPIEKTNTNWAQCIDDEHFIDDGTSEAE